MSNLILKPVNGCGFFSCCTCRLENIIQFYAKYGEFPYRVDSSEQFQIYKPTATAAGSTEDITHEYFSPDAAVDAPRVCPFFENDSQYADYRTLHLTELSPFVNKYFSLSESEIIITQYITQKYSLDYNNTCVLFYRGNDKMTETETGDYAEIYEYARKIQKDAPDIIFLLQSDEVDFIDYFSDKFPANSVVFYNETRHIPRAKTSVDVVFRDKNFEFSKYFLAITWIMSQCKYVVCNTGNCSLWIALYRGNMENVYQIRGKSTASWKSSGFISYPHENTQ